MNPVDLAIIGTFALPAVMGLRSGILLPASGVAGIVLGVVLAVQYHGPLAFAIADHVEGEAVRRVAAFAGIVLITAMVTRTAATLARRLLSFLRLGWADRAAGAAAGALAGLVIAGTLVFVLTGAHANPVRDLLRSSSLTTSVSHASLISTPSPWCSEITVTESSAVPATAAAAPSIGTAAKSSIECTDPMDLVAQLLGSDVSTRLSDLLAQDLTKLAQLVKMEMAGSPQEVADPAHSP